VDRLQAGRDPVGLDEVAHRAAHEGADGRSTVEHPQHDEVGMGLADRFQILPPRRADRERRERAPQLARPIHDHEGDGAVHRPIQAVRSRPSVAFGSPAYRCRMNETVQYEVDGAVATITLNRPEHLNTMSADLLAGTTEALEDAAADESVRAVILTGAGRGFCA